MTGPVGVGFIGAGMISDTYLENLTSFPDVEVVIDLALISRYYERIGDHAVSVAKRVAYVVTGDRP